MNEVNEHLDMFQTYLTKYKRYVRIRETNWC